MNISHTHTPGEFLEGAEGHHGSHALTRWREGGVQKNVAHAGHVYHAVVVQVGREGHSENTQHTHTHTISSTL